jgi:hypothetical protein
MYGTGAMPGDGCQQAGTVNQLALAFFFCSRFADRSVIKEAYSPGRKLLSAALSIVNYETVIRYG